MTLYADEKVQFGGLAVGGIRISHMSHIDAPVTMALTVTRANKKAFTVKPMKVEGGSGPARITRDQQAAIADAAKKSGITGADVFAHFNVDKLSSILSSQYADVLAWVEKQGQPEEGQCEHCQQVNGHADSCPLAEPPEGV